MHSPIVVAVGGFASNVGKTAVMCNLINAFPGWEAIKTTRGHYRSCGKDPHSCCVSHLLSDEPVIRSGREETYAPGKDTGRYWDAGAENVHWVIAAEDQVEKGINQTLGRVRSQGVLIEGNSFTEFVKVDYFVMVARRTDLHIKSSARRALRRASALYVWDEFERQAEDAAFNEWLNSSALKTQSIDLPLYSHESLSQLVAEVRAVSSSVANTTSS
jgi:hypothetical protein